jgi:hypothetical protein
MDRKFKRWAFIFLFGVAVIVAMIVVIALNVGRNSMTVTLDRRPQFLSDALAIEKAKEAMHRAGYDARWEPLGEGRTVAPDGTRDVYLLRNALNPNLGTISFLDEGNRKRIVQIELDGDRLTCEVIMPR